MDYSQVGILVDGMRFDGQLEPLADAYLGFWEPRAGDRVQFCDELQSTGNYPETASSASVEAEEIWRHGTVPHELGLRVSGFSSTNPLEHPAHL